MAILSLAPAPVKPEVIGIGVRLRRGITTAVIALWSTVAAGCQQTPEAPTSTDHPTSTAIALAGCPLASDGTGPQVLLSGLPAPDDLAFDANGRLLFSDINTGAVSAVDADGSIEKLAGGLDAPEGMLTLPDGRILVAEQGRNRITAIDAQTHALTLWRAFSNRTANAGIDGIGPIVPAADASGKPLAHAGDVIVPDSPNGLLWAVTPDGKSATEIAAGMTRPVGAAIDRSGRIVVSDEGGAVWMLDPLKHRLATLATPDDVVVTHDGNLFINTLGDNAIHELDGQGRSVAVLGGISQPQGIALDGADNLYYTEFTRGRIDRRLRTFLLRQSTATTAGGRRFLICPAIARAQAFADSLSLTVASGSGVTVLRTVQPGTDSSGALEVQTSNASVEIAVSDPSRGLRLSQTVVLPS